MRSDSGWATVIAMTEAHPGRITLAFERLGQPGPFGISPDIAGPGPSDESLAASSVCGRGEFIRSQVPPVRWHDL
jgi:hypothetical protein